METEDIWGMIKSDRETFADYLAKLDQNDWETQSLCDEWTVKGVATHLLVTPMFSKGRIFSAFLTSGFNLDKTSAKFVKELCAEMSADEIVAKTRDTAGVENAPPGLKPIGVLVEVLTHTTDISLPVGNPLDLPPEHYVVALEYMKNVSPIFHSKQRIAGLHLKATDAEWTNGDGPLVEGSASHLLSAMTGRKAVLDSLAGDGVETMRSRK